MRLPDAIATTTDWSCPKALRERIIQVARSRKVALNEADLNKWLVASQAKMARVGRLMTDQQYDDYRAGRKLGLGDKAKFVGERREEKAQNGRVTYRPFGQTGAITKLTEGQHNLVSLTFTPDTPSELVGENTGDPPLVILEAQVMTNGWPLIERIPPSEEEQA